MGAEREQPKRAVLHPDSCRAQTARDRTRSLGKAFPWREPHPERSKAMTVRAWWSRIRASLRRDDALEQEMEREMAFHREMSTQRNVRRGMTPEEATRQARLAFGSTEAVKEEARDAYRARVAERIANDVRFALRGLRRSP